MIDVKITYRRKNTIEEKYEYLTLEVKGHANSGDMNSVKCCAGVSAILMGEAFVFDERYCNVKIEKGYFSYKRIKSNEENNISVYVMICQLFNVYQTYPHLFNSFNLIDLKGDLKDE